MKTSLFVGSIVVLALTGLHCSSSSTGPADAGNADTGAADSGADAATIDAGADAGATVNGCTPADFAASDETAAAAPRAIAFPMGGAPAQFTPHCMKIKVGQSVSWNGNFSAHPLEAMGGDSGNPIAQVSTGTTTSIAFPSAGTFGFDCANHPSSMFGAILVVP